MLTQLGARLLAVCLLASAAGCASELPQGHSHPPADDLTARLDAAREILDVSQRDAAFTSLARLAADQGDSTIVKAAINEISDSQASDDAAAAAAAIRLAEAGERSAGLEVARLIRDVSNRDAALKQLAAQ